MNSENEKLRALLARTDEYLAAKGVGYQAKLRVDIRAALFQQAEPVEPATTQDELTVFAAWYATEEAFAAGDSNGWYGVARAAWMARAGRPEQSAPQHSDDEAVDRFAVAMKAKLAASREKGRHGWQKATAPHLSALLYNHMYKADPLDVANLAMMLHQNGQAIELPQEARGRRQTEQKPVAYTWEGCLHDLARGMEVTVYPHKGAGVPIPLYTAPVAHQGVLEHVSEGAEMLQNLIDNIESKGNYSAESTVLFLNQALGCIRAALEAQGGE